MVREFKKGRQCKATSKRTGQRCQLAAIKGGFLCKFHGGYEPHHRMRAALASNKYGYGNPIEIDPALALLNQVYESAGNVAFLRMMVQSLGDEVAGPVGNPDYYVEWKPDVLIQMYDSERDRLARISKMCLDVGIAERQLKIAEAHGELLVGVIKAVLDDGRLELTDKQREVGRLIAGEQFRQLAVGAQPRS